MSRRTETAYKAQSPGKSAQHDEAQGSGDRVNAAPGVSRWSLTCVEKDHVLIRGDLFGMRFFGVSFYNPVKLPAGRPVTKSRRYHESILPDIEIRNKEERIQDW